MKRIAILGATGSVGKSTLDVIKLHEEYFNVVALTANTRVEELIRLSIVHQPEIALIADASKLPELKRGLEKHKNIQVLGGVEALSSVAESANAELVMAAIVGAAGLEPTLSAVKQGCRVLLANKEALVMSGEIFMREVEKHNATLLPVDSEHNAIFQCLHGQSAQEKVDNQLIRRLILTASGGPFLHKPLDDLSKVTPQEACKHPNWEMGRKISVDSATMMNKGLEFIEAHWLFAMEPDRINIVIHPQSVIHSMVEYIDGSILAQMGSPDMRIPIAHALSWPNRMMSGSSPLDLMMNNRLDFLELDARRFPCVELAKEVLVEGGAAPAILNAANEIAVDAFLSNQIGFTHIEQVIEDTLSSYNNDSVESLEAIKAVDFKARAVASQLIMKEYTE
ncbi:MAG: 1-deoxy-D-xylulose-5-phosphate reductoisomerase [Pseudomonadota bacterium]